MRALIWRAIARLLRGRSLTQTTRAQAWGKKTSMLSVHWIIEGVFYALKRMTPSPMVLRCFSGYFRRAFSACCFVLKGFDNGVNSPAMNLKSNHCSVDFGIQNL